MTTLNKILWKHVKVEQPLTVDELRCLRDVGAELTRLRGIERAAMVNLSRENAIKFWRRRAEMFGDDALTKIADSLIADALEAKP